MKCLKRQTRRSKVFDVLSGAIGEIHSIDETNYTAKVKLLEHDNYITSDLQILTPLAFQNKINCLPAINTPCMVIFFGDREDKGFIIGCWNSKANPALRSKGKLMIDFQKSKMEINEEGNINVKTEKMVIDTKTLTVNADEHIINAKLKVNGETTIVGNTVVTGKFEADEVKEGEIILGSHKTSGVTSGKDVSGSPMV